MAARAIRPMTFSDIDRVAAIEQATFTVPWSTDLFMGQLRRSTSILLVCEIEGVVVAYLIADSFVDVWHIMNIAVDVPYRRDHIASELIEAYFAITEQSEHRGHTLEVRVSNEAAIEMYRSFGFIATGVRPKYYPDDKEDAVIMWKDWGGEFA